jgi:hypothetical protein
MGKTCSTEGLTGCRYGKVDKEKCVILRRCRLLRLYSNYDNWVNKYRAPVEWHWQEITLIGYDTDRVWHWQEMTLTGYDIDRVWHWQGVTLTGYDNDRKWHWQGMTLTGYDTDRIWHWQGNRSDQTKTHPRVILPAINSTRTDLRLNSGLRNEGPATNDLCHGTLQHKLIGLNWIRVASNADHSVAGDEPWLHNYRKW